jgi:hypothetical protein
VELERNLLIILKGENNMTKIAKNLTDLIGNTPLLELANYGTANNLGARLIAKRRRRKRSD